MPNNNGAATSENIARFAARFAPKAEQQLATDLRGRRCPESQMVNMLCPATGGRKSRKATRKERKSRKSRKVSRKNRKSRKSRKNI